MPAYTPLLEIVATHAYYAGGRCPGLHFEPTARTATWLREVDGLCRDTGSGMLILGDAERLGAPAGSPPALAWVLRCDDARFSAVTAGLPTRGEGAELMWFKPVADAAAPGGVRLHVASEAGPDDLWPRTWPMVAMHLGPAERRRLPLGVLEVPPPRARPDASGHVRHTIRFAARAPIWKYCLVGHWSDHPLEVVAASGALSAVRGEAPFGKATAETLPDGRPVLSFRSARGIELRERPERRFTLRSAADKRVLLERLPMAGAENLAFEPDGDRRELVSEILVHR